MVIKTSVSFLNTDSDAQLVARTEAVVNAMTGNPGYPTPTPTLAVVTTAKDEFITAMSDATDGGTRLTAIKNAKRAALVGILRQLATYVQLECKGDLTLLMSSGFPIQKPQRTPVGVLPAPSLLTVTFGERSGELYVAAVPMVGAAIYNWRVTTVAAPEVVVQTAQTTAASNTFTGLTPGVVYQIDANAVGSAGPSNWSAPMPQRAV
ncbi:MAG: hypothetical protein ACTHKU_12110 [Verrucomicrobiota bacterium]